MKKIIFHHPLEVGVREESASGLRPKLIREGFIEAGFEVFDIVGSSHQRKAAFTKIKARIKNGEKFEFLYSETSTIPSMLCDPHHFPIRPFLDFQIFQCLRKHGVKVGVFYRDMHWRFPHYKNSTTLLKRMILQPFFRLEAILLSYSVDVLFLPSAKMAKDLPQVMRKLSSRPLPPGSKPETFTQKAVTKPIQLLYVGGITPPAYGIKDLLQCLSEIKDVETTIVCRKSEWDNWQDYYQPVLGKNIFIKHLQGKELRQEFKKAQVFLNVYNPYTYRTFAFPFKIMEAIGWALPIVTMGAGPDSEFIEANKVGWRLSTMNDLGNLIRTLIQDPTKITEASLKAHEVSITNSWQSRALNVELDLERHS